MLQKYTHRAPHNKNTIRGFTMVEIVVVIALLAFASLFIIVGSNRFSSATLLKSLAYEIALTVREAQVFGLAVRESASGTNVFNAGYGVHFEDMNNTEYILFSDGNEDLLYTSGELVRLYTIGKGNYVADFCATTILDEVRCASSGDINSLDIVFVRPEPDAHIQTNISTDTYKRAVITVASARGTTRLIEVLITGQIAVLQ